ncbi:apolipoprotein N-acyltransferase [Myxococcota bacterium]|nr:apolipoprotein N-acyltransferase [Myxococcota bacterium]
MLRSIRIALLAGYVVVSFWSFPQPVLGVVVDLGAGLAWFAPALLVLGLRGLAPRQAALWGFTAALVAHSAILHWIYVVTVTYGHAAAIVGWVAPVFLAVYVALPTALFGGLLSWLSRRGLDGAFAVAALWMSLDQLRSWLFTGFPWASLGYAQHLNPAMLGLASLIGVYGLSFVTALGGVALAHLGLAIREGLRPARQDIWALVCVVLLLVLGWGSFRAVDDVGLPRVRVAVAQGNIEQGVKWSPAWKDRTLSIYEGLTRQAAEAGAQIVVWPESAVPGGLEPYAQTGRRVADLARETGVSLVVGAVGLEYDRVGRVERFFDSAFVLDAAGRIQHRYDKSHLVPFGEYVPFRDLIGRFMSAVARGIATGDVSQGSGPRALTVPLEVGPDARVGLPVCFELLFPALVRGFVADGAQALFAMTNDAWYGRTGAPYQFLAITALRSAENRIWTARAANTGVSAFIDARGRVRSQTRIFEPGLLLEDVPLRAGPRGGSLYTRHGGWITAAGWLTVSALLVVGLRRAR